MRLIGYVLEQVIKFSDEITTF